ncbi:sigma-54 factor interaction domain-containing protein [Vibrio chagasii]|nr:sigma-54 factor interaction domain-containing protein [Vibrio chagasii]
MTGESGTGKVCAEAIHAASKRGDKPFYCYQLCGDS